MAKKTEGVETAAESCGPLDQCEEHRKLSRMSLWVETFGKRASMSSTPGECSDFAKHALKCFDEAFPAKG